MSSKFQGVIKNLKTQHSEISSIQNVDVPRLGRPRTGKRSDPAFRQVSAWIRKDTYDEVTKRLFLEENRREFSELVQDLLKGWLSK